MKVRRGGMRRRLRFDALQSQHKLIMENENLKLQNGIQSEKPEVISLKAEVLETDQKPKIGLSIGEKQENPKSENVDVVDQKIQLINQQKQHLKIMDTKYPCPVPGCKSGNKQIRLYQHLYKIHNMRGDELKIWLLEARLIQPLSGLISL